MPWNSLTAKQFSAFMRKYAQIWCASVQVAKLWKVMLVKQCAKIHKRSLQIVLAINAFSMPLDLAIQYNNYQWLCIIRSEFASMFITSLHRSWTQDMHAAQHNWCDCYLNAPHSNQNQTKSYAYICASLCIMVISIHL